MSGAGKGSRKGLDLDINTVDSTLEHYQSKTLLAVLGFLSSKYFIDKIFNQIHYQFEIKGMLSDAK